MLTKKKDATVNGAISNVECIEADKKCTSQAENEDKKKMQEMECKNHGSGCAVSVTGPPYKCEFDPVGHCVCSGAAFTATTLCILAVFGIFF